MSIFKDLAADLLEISAEEFSRHGCNDISDEISQKILAWSPLQKSYFISMGEKWNNGPIEIEPEDLHLISDWMLMDILAYILKHESDEK